ncbi:hypothetical protein PUNSTDRAFT_138662 [Punctularia strigosozonata HHB-11173 SS5]|uniref:Uncharacterized protein n=1 Tax=Punctularia strigosozonata (strain HHB-11173) TaxID=741275 RepID=R7S4T4_PUNST|nr:uncharacterized protein PUNSTDRAFT_138662 [Punctularia strigosozonata HHB-11173 SS5]EIN04266.1 hypothetical protein PUNSTDRAFT_138662 [Punctularia strigosozonata HHB-11173 SS5]
MPPKSLREWLDATPSRKPIIPVLEGLFKHPQTVQAAYSLISHFKELGCCGNSQRAEKFRDLILHNSHTASEYLKLDVEPAVPDPTIESESSKSTDVNKQFTPNAFTFRSPDQDLVFSHTAFTKKLASFDEETGMLYMSLPKPPSLKYSVLEGDNKQSSAVNFFHPVCQVLDDMLKWEVSKTNKSSTSTPVSLSFLSEIDLNVHRPPSSKRPDPSISPLTRNFDGLSYAGTSHQF